MRLPESGLLAEEEYVDYLDEPTSLDNIASFGQYSKSNTGQHKGNMVKSPSARLHVAKRH